MGGSVNEMDTDQTRKLYSECIQAIKICLESLTFVADNCPTDGIVRNRAEKTITEVNKLLRLDK